MSVLQATSIKVRDVLGLTARGQTTKANSLPVTIASDQTLAAGQAFHYANSPSIDMTAITYDTDDVIGALNTISDATNTKALRLDNIILRALNVGVVKDYLLIFFGADPTSSTFTDGGSVSIHVDDKAKVTLMLSVGDTEFSSIGAGGSYFASASVDVGKVIGCTGDLFYVIVAKETISGVADALELSIGVTQDG